MEKHTIPNNYPIEYPEFDKVLFVGPDIKGQGGIASVLESYKKYFAPFHYVRSNSRMGGKMGKVANAGVLAWLLLSLPFRKWFGNTTILHAHVAADKSFIRKTIIIRWARLLGYKIVYHSHSSKIKDYTRTVGREKIERTLHLADLVMVLSRSWAEFFGGELHAPNVLIVDNIVSRPPEALSAVAPPPPLNLLFLGAIGHRKGIFDLLEVIAQNAGRWRGKLHLTIGGAGEQERLIRFIADNSLDDIVEFAGWVRGEQKSHLLAQCHCLILPSYNEGLPISILEAMSHGKAIISTTVGGIPEVIHHGHNGFITAPGDKQAIATAIDNYINNPALMARHGGINASLLENNFPEAVARRLREAYRSLLS